MSRAAKRRSRNRLLNIFYLWKVLFSEWLLFKSIKKSAKIKQTYESEKVAKRAPEAHIPTGHYVIFEKEDQTLKGNPGFNRYCYFARINFKPGNGYLDETLEIPLTKANSYIGQVIYVSNFCRVENFAIFGKLVFTKIYNFSIVLYTRNALTKNLMPIYRQTCWRKTQVRVLKMEAEYKVCD